jgi:hypothetical protein
MAGRADPTPDYARILPHHQQTQARWSSSPDALAAQRYAEVPFSEIRTTMTQPNYPPPHDPNAEGWQQQGAYPPAGYPQGGYPPQFYVPPRKTNSLALTSMIVSIVSVAMCPLIGIVGAIMGHKAKGQIRQTGEDGDGMATAGIIIGWIVFGLFMLFIVVYGVIIGIAAANGAFDSSSTY